MRFAISCIAAALLALLLASCSGGSKNLTADKSVDGFTLTDAEIDAFEASPEADWRDNVGVTSGGRQSVVPMIFAERASSPGKGVSTYGNGSSSKCGKCKTKCNTCTKKKKSCKCQGKCKQKKQKCNSCKDKCGKCSKKAKCGCEGKCKQTCKKCTSGCGKCNKDGNCGCKSKCKQKCGKCKSNCKKCKKNGNCGCSKCECPPCPCNVKCKSIASTGELNYVMDCETGCADATYKVHLTFTDCPGVDSEALGREVVFVRNGVEVGRATTDINGDAWITDLCLEPGTYNITASHGKCVVCFDVCIKDQDCCEVQCTGITSSTDEQFEADCETHCADVEYKVNLTFNDCPGIDNEAAGKEVVFLRQGTEIGRAVTDINGDAVFSDECLDLGGYTITAQHEDCVTEFDVVVYEDCCEFICTGIVNDTERFFEVENCGDDCAPVTYRVQLQFNECPGQEPMRAGHEVVFTRDGVEVGTAVTDANGVATLSEDCVELDTHHVTAVSDHCATEFDITTFEQCTLHACITGKGKLAGKNGSQYMTFAYEGHVDRGQLVMANWFSLSDGDINYDHAEITWMIINGLEVYFGNDEVMFRTVDNGKAPGVDVVEVFVFDRDYHNEGNLLNGQIRTSWGILADPNAPPMYMPHM